MAFKFVTILTFIALTNAGVVYHSAPATTNSYIAPASGASHTPLATTTYTHNPVYHANVKHAGNHQSNTQDEDYDSHPQYKFAYDVEDAVSGDSKSQVEERDGDAVHGEYSLIDADGYKRTVQYTADDHNGFNAVVNRVPLGHGATLAHAPVQDYSHPVVYQHQH